MDSFRDAARRKDFVVLAEPFLKPETDRRSLALQLGVLRDAIDGLLITDNQAGRLHLSSVAAASIALESGVDPVVQLSCRNRNRIALLADLLGAAALGATSVVLVRGQRVPAGFEPRPKAVLDVDAQELIAMATRLRAEGPLQSLPDLYVGTEFTLHRPAPDWKPAKLLAKATNGAQFAVSNLCMDIDVVRQYLAHVVAAGLPRKINIYISIAIPESAADARWLRDARPNNLVPDEIVRRLEGAADAEDEGVQIGAELLQQVREIPGVRGVNLVATRNLQATPAVLAAAGLAGGETAAE